MLDKQNAISLEIYKSEVKAFYNMSHSDFYK